jgi:hypothetical protein
LQSADAPQQASVAALTDTVSAADGIELINDLLTALAISNCGRDLLVTPSR